jgi:hypothetical protein
MRRKEAMIARGNNYYTGSILELRQQKEYKICKEIMIITWRYNIEVRLAAIG